MRGFLAILRREFVVRRNILAAAALASLIPLAIPIVRHLGSSDAVDARGWTALIVSVAFSVGVAIALGASALVPRVLTRKIGFDFHRPVSGAAVWFGTVSAATGLAIAAAAIVWTPSYLLGAKPIWSDLISEPFDRSLWPWFGLAAIPVLVSTVHALTLIVRSRSARLVFDAIMGLAAWFGISRALVRLTSDRAFVPWWGTLLVFCVSGTVAVVLSGAASISRGRTEIAAAHRALSTTFWSVILATVLVANAYSVWVVSAGPNEIASNRFWAFPSANGPWIEVAGNARGAAALLLCNVQDGRFARIRNPDSAGALLSRDGQRAVWISGNRGDLPIWTWNLGASGSRPESTRLVTRTPRSLIDLSTDGSRLALLESDLFTIYDLPAQRTLVSARVPVAQRSFVVARFVGRDVLRIYCSTENAVEILEIDAASRRLSHRASFERGADFRFLGIDPPAKRILIEEGPSRTLRLLDGSTGTPIATVTASEADGRDPAFLPDGRIVVLDRIRKKNQILRVYGGSGQPEREIALPTQTEGHFGGEVAPGKLWVGIGNDSWLADLDSGELRKVADGLVPLYVQRLIPDVGSEATKLLFGPEQRSLVRFDPLTGERRTLLGKP